MSFQVGDLTSDNEADPVFNTIQEACNYALEMCEESDEALIGVWTNDDRAELLAIAYQGDLFQK